MTLAERTNFRETSHYQDVMEFIRGLQAVGAPVALKIIGQSAEGRDIPLMIVSRLRVTEPREAKRLGLPVIYVQANIHAGEVEGKEAILHLVRKYCQEKTGVLDRVILLVNPIYNADGNEKFGPQSRNRPGQGGPEMVGLRANGQGLDLNRDYIKAETPEHTSALASIYTTWDPDVFMDLHTTDGTRHGYALTYAPPLNSNTAEPVQSYARDVLMPTIRKNLRTQFSLETFDYGNAENRGGKVSWYEVGPEPRYSTNYSGLRNRIGVLSEALTYLSFRDRIVATERFVNAIVRWTANHADEVLAQTRAADQMVISWGLNPAIAPELGVRFEAKSRGIEGVLLEKKGEKAQGVPKNLETVPMEIYDRFKPTKSEKFPAGYLIPSTETHAINLLVKHGIRCEKFMTAWYGMGEEFTISKFSQDSQPFQGHKLMTLDGDYTRADLMANTGDVLVRTAQPLGILAFSMLEPESTDGLLAWGFLGESWKAGQHFPVRRMTKPVTAVTELIKS